MELLPFSTHIEIRSRGYLSHWEIDDAIYFITYRLADSLPAEVVEQLEREHENLVRLIGEETTVQRQKVRSQYLRRLNAYLDEGYGAGHLRDAQIAEYVLNRWKRFDGERYRLVAWCVMPNHVHVIIRLFYGRDLSRTVGLWKGNTSRYANQVLNREGPFWFRDYYDHCIRTQRELERTIDYVLGNPATAGLTNWPFVGCAG